MREKQVYVERRGVQELVGFLRENAENEVCFSYAQEYLDKPDFQPISISMQKTEEAFPADVTRVFFEGLLPEGFTRKSVAGWLHVAESDYMSILYALGQECLGAIRIDADDVGIPEADYVALTTEEVNALAKEGAGKSAELVTKAHLSLTGASGKVGLLYEDGVWYLPKGDAPSTHIVKQSHVRLDSIVLNEHLCLLTAKLIGMDVTESSIINLGNGEDENVLFASRRYDRVFDDNCTYIAGRRRPWRLHQEDFAQAMGIGSQDKYEREGGNYLRDMFSIIQKYSANPIEDGLKLWDMLVFDYLIGNTDNHIKNKGLLYAPDLGSVRLAPSYDILSTCIYEHSTRNMAFHIGGKYDIDEMNRSDFTVAAGQCGIGERMAMRRFDDMQNRFEDALKGAADLLMDRGLTKANAIRERILKSRASVM